MNRRRGHRHDAVEFTTSAPNRVKVGRLDHRRYSRFTFVSWTLSAFRPPHHRLCSSPITITLSLFLGSDRSRQHRPLHARTSRSQPCTTLSRTSYANTSTRPTGTNTTRTFISPLARRRSSISAYPPVSRSPSRLRPHHRFSRHIGWELCPICVLVSATSTLALIARLILAAAPRMSG